MGYKKMYNDTIEFDQELHKVNIPSTSTFNIAGTAVTASAAELNTITASAVTNADLVKLHAVTATAANINAVANAAVVSVTGAGALSAASHGGRVTVINSSAGIAITLPAATGTGTTFKLYIGITVGSGTTTITTASGSDFIAGTVLQAKTDGSTKTYNANGTSHRVITMDGTTKGGVIGDSIRLTDIKANVWSLEVIQQASGVVANPIS